MALRAAMATAVTATALAAASPASAVTAASVQRVAGGGTIPANGGIATAPPFTLALDADFSSVGGIGVAGDDIVVPDADAARFYEFTPGGVIFKVAGSTLGTDCGTTPANPTYTDPYDSVAFGSLYLVADGSADHVCQVDTGANTAGLFAGTTEGWVDGNATTTAKFNLPIDLEPFSGGVLIADELNHAIRKYVGGTVSTVAGAPANNTPPAEPPDPLSDATAADIGLPHAVSAISESHYFVANEFQVLEVKAGKIQRVAGGGSSEPADGGQATGINFNPGGLQALRGGGFLVYDDIGNRILRVSQDGVVSTLAAGLASGGRFALSDHALYVTQFDTVARILASEIASGPADGSHVGTGDATFGFASWDEGASFACRVDSIGSYSPCGTLSGLSQGKHQIEVQATTDSDRVDPAPVRREWYVDLTPPDPFELQAPDPGASFTDPEPRFSWAPTTDPGGLVASGVDHYELVIDGSNHASVTPGQCGASCNAAAQPVSDGVHHWQVRAVDKVGHARLSPEREFTVAVPPVAIIYAAPARALAGRSVAYDASASHDVNGTIVNYRWDLDGDGTFESDTGGTPTTSRTYPTPMTFDAKVRVTDSGGLTTDAQVHVIVTAQAPAGKPLGVSIDDGAQYTNDPEVTIFAVWPSFASNAFVSNDGGFKAGRLFPVAEKIPWTLDSSGPERLPKTVYVRFQSGPQTSETYTDDIILDQTPPKVLSASLSSGASAPGAAAARKVTLKIKAKDNVSGVGVVQVTKNKRKPGRYLRFRKTLKVVPARTLYVRVRDRAGNLSAWRVAKRR